MLCASGLRSEYGTEHREEETQTDKSRGADMVRCCRVLQRMSLVVPEGAWGGGAPLWATEVLETRGGVTSLLQLVQV